MSSPSSLLPDQEQPPAKAYVETEKESDSSRDCSARSQNQSADIPSVCIHLYRGSERSRGPAAAALVTVPVAFLLY